jgi:hypothetical protein
MSTHKKKHKERTRRYELQERATVLAEERATRTPAQQIKILDQRLGEGVGATKERARLQHQIDHPPGGTKKEKKKNGKPTKQKSSAAHSGRES